MNREQIEELAALDAMNALDGEDLAAWSGLQATDPAAARLRDELADAAAHLSLMAASVPVPDELRRRIMGAVFADGATEETFTSEAARFFGWSAWVAAAIVVFLALAGTSGITAGKEKVIVRDARANPAILSEKLGGYGDFQAANVTVLWDSGQRGWHVQAVQMPRLPGSHQYRLWAVDAEGTLHDCGQAPAGNGGNGCRFVRPLTPIDSMQGFAVTIEPADMQSPRPTSPAVLISPSLRRAS
jgi:hypothetical protein